MNLIFVLEVDLTEFRYRHVSEADRRGIGPQ